MRVEKRFNLPMVRPGARLGVLVDFFNLFNANPVESLRESITRITLTVKRWRNGTLGCRWGITALSEAERRFRRIQGDRGSRRLTGAQQAT